MACPALTSPLQTAGLAGGGDFPLPNCSVPSPQWARPGGLLSLSPCPAPDLQGCARGKVRPPNLCFSQLQGGSGSFLCVSPPPSLAPFFLPEREENTPPLLSFGGGRQARQKRVSPGGSRARNPGGMLGRGPGSPPSPAGGGVEPHLGRWAPTATRRSSPLPGPKPWHSGRKIFLGFLVVFHPKFGQSSPHFSKVPIASFRRAHLLGDRDLDISRGFLLQPFRCDSLWAWGQELLPKIVYSCSGFPGGLPSRLQC